MTEGVKNQTIVERFNRYIDYRKTSEKTGVPFSEQLARKAEKTKDEEPRKGEPLRSARRLQPPRLCRPKAITTVQAQRLARYAPAIEACARKYGVPVEIICGVILQESGGNARAVSPAGAKGMMQLMPGTARRFGVRNVFDPVQNIEGGTRYLRFLLDKFEGNISLALAGYNAGEHNVEKYGNKIPPFAETRGYVPNVLGYTQTMINIFHAKLNQPEIPLSSRRV